MAISEQSRDTWIQIDYVSHGAMKWSSFQSAAAVAAEDDRQKSRQGRTEPNMADCAGVMWRRGALWQDWWRRSGRSGA